MFHVEELANYLELDNEGNHFPAICIIQHLKEWSTLFINQNLVCIDHQFMGPVQMPSQQCFLRKWSMKCFEKICGSL
jgi:hypothetical protein